jgi:hypothetical protein
MSTFEWTDNGTSVLPIQHRATFLAHLRGEHTVQGDYGGKPVKWIAPVGMMPMTPAMGLQAAVREFDIKPVTAVSHNLAWLCDDRTHKPGYAGGYTATYGLLGVRTRKQAIYFIDTGITIVPVLIETLAEPADFIEPAGAAPQSC